MHRRVLLATVAATASGCTRANQAETNTTSTTGRTTTTEVDSTTTTTTRTTTEATPDIRLVDVEAPATVAYGDSVTFTLTFENRGGAGSYVDTGLILDPGKGTRTGAPVQVEVPAGETVTTETQLRVLALGAVTVHLVPDQHVKTTRIQLDVTPATLPVGESFVYEDKLRVGVAGVETPDKLYVDFSDGYYYPDEGRQYVIVDAVVENTRDAWRLFSMNDLVLKAGGEQFTWNKFLPEHDVATVSDLEREMIVIGNSLEASARHTGGIWFDIPADIPLSTVRFGRIYKDRMPVSWRP